MDRLYQNTPERVTLVPAGIGAALVTAAGSVIVRCGQLAEVVCCDVTAPMVASRWSVVA